jgi:hypothetical protein
MRPCTFTKSAREDKRGADLISDVLPFGRLWYDTPDNAIGCAMHSRSHDAVIRCGNRFLVHAVSSLSLT